MNGAERICAYLKRLGVEIVFGLPGTQNVVLFDAMRRSTLRSVVASDEGAAAFMATGYARATGSVGVLTTIPDPASSTRCRASSRRATTRCRCSG